MANDIRCYTLYTLEGPGLLVGGSYILVRE